MSRVRPLSLAASLLFVTAVPFVWLACGGGKPPETPADESANGDGAAPEPAASAAAESSSAAPASSDTSSSGAAAADTSAAAPATPAAPPMSGTDCGKCIEKTCSKQAAACGKNTDCQSTLDAFHSCGSDKGPAACLDAASLPTGAKPKKLATAYETCAKKASTGKACKAKCQ